MTQVDLARASHVSLAMVKSVERGVRNPSSALLEALALALGVDASQLDPSGRGPVGRVHVALPKISAAVAGYDVPLDPPGMTLGELSEAARQATAWRLAAQYGRIAAEAPLLLSECLAHLHAAVGPARQEAARLVVATARAADAVAFKLRAHDLSARLIEVMRWAASHTGDSDVAAVAAYVHAETFLASESYRKGQVVLEGALDTARNAGGACSPAALGALHMRTAVVAARGGDAVGSRAHLNEAARMAGDLAEGVHLGTAFGPSSVRIHEVAVAVSLGQEHVGHALDIARGWKPGAEIPAERRSGFFVELGRAQLWAARPDEAFESLKLARSLAPQHVRDHPWVREDIATLRRIKRGANQPLSAFAEWVGAA
jgi:transcriptional regulator with XRE-family HTH domain